MGDCWLLSTCAALAKKEELLFRVIDPKQVSLSATSEGGVYFNSSYSIHMRKTLPKIQRHMFEFENYPGALWSRVHGSDPGRRVQRRSLSEGHEDMMLTMREREAVLTVILTVTGLSLGLRSMEDLEEDVEVSVNMLCYHF